MRQLLDARGNPATAVLKALATVVVVPAQEGTAHAARDAVVPGGIWQADQGRAGTGHGGLSERGTWAKGNGGWGFCLTKWVSLIPFFYPLVFK